MSLTRMLREELSHISYEDKEQRIQLARAMVFCGGRIHHRASGSEVLVRCAYGSISRLLRLILVSDLGSRPDIQRHMGSNLTNSAAWVVSVGAKELRSLGLDITVGTIPRMSGKIVDSSIFLAGAIMVSGTLSDPLKPVHFELPIPTQEVTSQLSEYLQLPTTKNSRLVIKNAGKVQHILELVGAVNTLDNFMKGRTLKALKKKANRTANADRANLKRAADAAQRQIQAIEEYVDFAGWGAIPDDLRPLALARISSPELTLSELGALLIPQVDKATVHRRLKRILQMTSANGKEND